ncbi:MAG: hypothetical protein AAFX94_11090, partial [Myxococcota bacterium]
HLVKLAVTVAWPPFASDPPASVRSRLPESDFVARLSLFRGEELVATLKAGERLYVDRPSVEWLEAGATYTLRVTTESGQQAVSEACPALGTAQRDARYELQLASAGARFLKRPSALEREVTTRLRGDLAKRDELWDKTKGRQDLLDTWWQQVPEFRRREWLDNWVELQGGVESLWFNRPPELSERDRKWVLASLWLETQDRLVRKEVDRVWKLVHPSRRAEVERVWYESRDPQWRSRLAEQLRSADETVRAGLLGPARIAYWVGTKDPAEFRAVEMWWQDLGEEQGDVLSEWIGRQAPELRRELRWPSAAALTQAERDARMAAAPSELPPDLRPEFLAWWRFEELAGEERVTAVAADVGGLRAGWERLRYRTRAFDRATGFNGVVIYGLFVLLLPIPAVWFLRRRRRFD